MVTVEDGRHFIADAVISTLPLGILKAKLIDFEPKLPAWKLAYRTNLQASQPHRMNNTQVSWDPFPNAIQDVEPACGSQASTS